MQELVDERCGLPPCKGRDFLLDRETKGPVCTERELHVLELLEDVAARNGMTLSELLADEERWRRVFRERPDPPRRQL